LRPQPIALTIGRGFGGAGGLGGLGGFQDRADCVDRLQMCYVDCSLRYRYDQDSVNNLNREMRDACEDACDAMYRSCRGGLGVA
jgi:hypothetical protein